MRKFFLLMSVMVVMSVTADSFGQTPPPPTNPIPAAADPGTATFKWIYAAIIKPKCLGCHSEAQDYNSMIQSGWIAPGYPENSDFYGTMTSGYMPQDAKPVGARGLRAVYWWIKAGAKPTPAN